MSPYVVTTWTENVSSAAHAEGYTQEISSRRAVATLDEARSDVRAIALDHNSIGAAQKSRTLPESGGTVGPLPDGTVIEVEQVSAADLAKRASLGVTRPWHTHDYVIAAFNAQESTR